MLELSHTSLRSALRAHPGLWLLCAALVFGAGIACDGDDFGGGAPADVEGTWTLDQDITGGDCAPRVRDAMAIDQDGTDLVLMFDPTGFARASLSDSTIGIAYELELSTQTTELAGTLTLSDDGTTLTGDVTFAITAGTGSPCTQDETWTATRTSTSLPAAAHDSFENTWSVTITADSSCDSGEGTSQLTITQEADGSVTIEGFDSADPVGGFVTDDFLRAAWQADASTTSFDAVFEWQDLGVAGEFIFGDAAHSVPSAACEGNDGYQGPPE